MKTIKILALVILLTSAKSFAQSSSIKWMTITEAEAAMKKEPKKIITDIYTDWCGWCKRLDATTYKDPKVVDYINKNFYAVKFNAETHDDIIFKGTTYSYDASYRVNGLSRVLMGNSTGYPTTTFMDGNMEILSVVPGYIQPEMMLNILKYFGDDIYKTKDWNTYLNSVSPQD